MKTVAVGATKDLYWTPALLIMCPTRIMTNTHNDGDAVQPLNYCSHAIDDLLELMQACQERAPESAHALRCVIEMLQASVKFILPDCGHVLAFNEIDVRHFQLARLPFPCVAFEFPYSRYDGIDSVGEFEQIPATKRIALCWTSDYAPAIKYLRLEGRVASSPEGGTFIMSIYSGPSFEKWVPTVGCMFVSHEATDYPKDAVEEGASKIAIDALRSAGLVKAKAVKYTATIVPILSEMFAELTHRFGDSEKALAEIQLDTRDEVHAFVNACSVIACSNVELADVVASPALNKKRIANGKRPLFSYKVLQLDSENSRKSRAPSGGGSHASPRMHLRRGHIRRLDGRTIWVRSTLVNSSSEGVVLKDYSVR
jgi:hypothetical protein